MAVVAVADKLKLSDHHIPHSFLQLYFRKLHKEQNAKAAASTPAPTTPQ
jgi:nitrate/TMAO reductase-like tetraheme cytochrome c subunit